MSCPNDEGHRANGVPEIQKHNPPLHFASDGKWNYSKAVPCLRAVGNLLRQIGGAK